MHCTDNINALPLQRIGNNVEAFRYYLALKSGQFQHFKIIDKWFLRLCFVIYLPLTGGLYTCIKRGIIFYYWLVGSREPQNSSRRWFPRFFIDTPVGNKGKNRNYEMLS